MQFAVSERIKTKKSESEVIDELHDSFRKISESVKEERGRLIVETINATFGSINRTDKTEITVKKKENGFLVTADVTYKPSVAFWIILAITLLGYIVGALIPVGFYIWHKKLIREEIEKAFKNTKYELED